jgi:hypothetical protein
MVGRVETVGKPITLGDWSQGALAMVTVDKVFRGDVRRRVEMYINPDISVGQRVVFYVHKESADEVQRRLAWVNPGKRAAMTGPEFSPEPQLRADSACRHKHVLVNSEDGKTHLANLALLPPKGSGGSLRLRVNSRSEADWSSWGGMPVANGAILLTMGSKSIKGTTDVAGDVLFDVLPSGTYGLTLPKVSGFTLKCSIYPGNSCDALPIPDQALQRHHAWYSPDAAVKINLVNADGSASAAVAKFRLTSLAAPKLAPGKDAPFTAPPVVYFSTAESSFSEGDLQGNVAVAPGPYRIEMLLDDVEQVAPDRSNNFATDKGVRHAVVANTDATTVELRKGNNEVTFKLSAKLTPKTVTIWLPDPQAQLQDKPMITAWLLAADSNGRVQRLATWSQAKDVKTKNGEIGWTLSAIPGQTWLISAHEYKSKLEAERFVRVQKDVTLSLQMTSQKRP